MAKQFYFLRNISVKWKFVAAYFAVIIIPVILTGIYLYFQTSNSAIEQAQHVMEQNLMQTKASILQKEKIIENISNILAYDSDFTAFLDYEYDNENVKLQDYQFNYSPLINNILRQNNMIYAIRIYMDELIVTEMLNSYYSVSRAKSTKWYDSMSSQKPAQNGWKSSHTAMRHALRNTETDKTQVFSYSKNMISLNYQKSVGMLEIEIESSILFDMLRDKVISKLGNVFIVGSDNKIVSNNLAKLYGCDVSSSGFSNYKGKVKQNTVEEVNDEKAIVICIPIDEMNCSVVGIFPVRNFNEKIKDNLKQIILVLLLSSIVLGCIIYIITNALLRRLRKLVKAMKQVKDENLNVSVPVDSKDEFGELAINFNHMTGRIHELVETVYKIQLLEREAEFKALEAQINPHFLYNTLATISWVARKGNSQEIVKIANSLAKFYRLVLSKGGRLISVKEELDMVMAYIHIQKIRFEETFDVVYEIDNKVHDYKVLKNILQPLVENAINHGIEPKRQHGTIIIAAGEFDDKLIFKVIDDGIGMDASYLRGVLDGKIERSKGSGYAIKNIMERLKGYYGEGCEIEIFSRPGIGTSISIRISKFVT